MTNFVAQDRHTTRGMGLMSPPPHHDTYSVEDSIGIIYDLRNANPNGEVSVKPVFEIGVGVMAAGVAKAKAARMTVSGHDGMIGPAVSMFHFGLDLLSRFFFVIHLKKSRKKVWIHTEYVA